MSRLGALGVPALTIWALIVWAVFFKHVGLPESSGFLVLFRLGNVAGIAHHTGALLSATLIWVAAGLTGRLLLNRFGLRGRSAWETAAFSAGLGMSVFSMCFFLLGGMGILSTRALLGALSIVGFAGVWRNRDLAREIRWSRPEFGVPETILLGLLAVFAFVQASGPELFFDSLVYHLALPKLYLLEGRLLPVAHNVYAGFPMLVEFFYGVGLAAGGDAVTRMQSWGLGFAMIAAFIVAAGRERAGLGAALVFFATPFVAVGWGEPDVDIGTVFFTLLAVIAGERLLQARPEERRREAFLCGVFLGCALASKMTAWGLLPAAVVSLWTILPEPDKKKRVELVGIVTFIACAVLSPWLIKNIIHYGNPFFPFLHDKIAGISTSDVNWPRLRVDARAVDWTVVLSSGAEFRRWLFGFFSGATTGFESLRGDFSGPLYVLFLPWILLTVWKTPGSRLVVRAAAGVFVFWLLSTRMLRLFAPGLALLALASARCAYESEDVAWLKRLGRANILLFGVIGTAWFSKALHEQGLIAAFAGQLTREELLTTAAGHYPYPSFRAYEALNADAKPGRVLVLGDSRGYYLEKPFIVSSTMNMSPLAQWVAEARDARGLAETFRANEVMGFVFNLEGYFWTKDAAPLRIPVEKAPLFKEFWEDWLEPVWVSPMVAEPGMPYLAAYRVRTVPVHGVPANRPRFPFSPRS